MAPTQGTSPKFDQPPVVETVLGVQFSPLVNFTVGHFGWFWKSYLGSDWPKAEDAPVLMDQFEKFGDELSWGALGVQISISGNPPARLQITNAAGDRVIQIQNTRFIYNWRKRQNSYPSYTKCRSEFDQFFAKFRKFVGDAGLGELNLNQWELSYIDHVPKGPLWQGAADWHKILPGILGSSNSLAGTRFDGVGEWHYGLEGERGRLHVSMQRARAESASGPEILLLSWTGRGPILNKPGWDLDAGLRLGHETILRAFLEATSPEAQRAWGRRVL
jgi:uncharacterized protein (TIGR04255 family)